MNNLNEKKFKSFKFSIGYYKEDGKYKSTISKRIEII